MVDGVIVQNENAVLLQPPVALHNLGSKGDYHNCGELCVFVLGFVIALHFLYLISISMSISELRMS
jgi:hypothetical protein